MLKAIHFDRENLGQLFTKKFFIVILISIPSAIVADFFNIPLAWMIGPMIATSLIALNASHHHHRRHGGTGTLKGNGLKPSQSPRSSVGLKSPSAHHPLGGSHRD